MYEQKQFKQAKLKDDEFNPYMAFKSFIRIPRVLLAQKDLSLGAKLLYGVLVGFAFRYGTAWPKKQQLSDALGGQSFKTIWRWQNELRRAGLIRVKFKGNWLPNNFYFLKSSIFEDGPGMLTVVEADMRLKSNGDELSREVRQEVIFPPEFSYLATYDPIQQTAFGAAPEIVEWQIAMKAWFEGGQIGPRPAELGDVSFESPSETPQEPAATFNPPAEYGKSFRASNQQPE